MGSGLSVHSSMAAQDSIQNHWKLKIKPSLITNISLKNIYENSSPKLQTQLINLTLKQLQCSLKYTFRIVLCNNHLYILIMLTVFFSHFYSPV